MDNLTPLNPEVPYTPDAQAFVHAAGLISQAAQLVYPLNSLAGYFLIHQAQALLQDAEKVNAHQTGAVTSECSGCGGSCGNSEPEVSSEVKVEIDNLVNDIEELLKGDA